MKPERFNEVVEDRLNECKNILIAKDKEYSSDTDRLHNFKKAGEMKGKTPIETLDMMWLKHRVSIEDEMNKMSADPSYVPSQGWIDEKLTDNINYTLLLEGAIEDRRNALDTVNIATKDEDGTGIIREHIPVSSCEMCEECGCYHGFHSNTCSQGSVREELADATG